MAGADTELPDGWTWTKPGLDEFDRLTKKIQDLLLKAAIIKTEGRESQTIDFADCRDASQFLIVGEKESGWKVFFRVLVAIAILVAGVLVKSGFDPEVSPANAAAFLVGGALLAVLAIVVQETLLR